MNERFIVVPDNENWYIKDTWYPSQEMAVCIFLANFDNAKTICALMNEEWRKFLINPT
jgi:hypothetical protein